MRRVSTTCRHVHTGEVEAIDARESDAVCVDGVAGVMLTDPAWEGGRMVLYLDGVDDLRVDPQDVIARVSRGTVQALYAEEDDYLDSL